MSEDNDAEAIFGKMVADELRCLPKKLKIMLKHEINQSIYLYQMKHEESNEQTTSSQNTIEVATNNVTQLHSLFPVAKTLNQTTFCIPDVPTQSSYRQLLEE